MITNTNVDSKVPTLPSAARFWEPRRLVYNAILTLVVLLWLILTWPHFQSALTLSSLGKFAVLALLANLCYCAAYAADFFMQAALPIALHRRLRWTIWVLGMLLALVVENYWIADEIYPDFPQTAAHLSQGLTAMTPPVASNMNFPAPLAVLGFLAACGGTFLAVASVLIFWFARKPKFARIAAIAIGAGAVVYFALLFGFSADSHATTLARGHEKYFCEIDCHLAYSVVDVKTQSDGRFIVTLRTRFDETTTSPSRPKDVPLTPSPRAVHLIDSAGHDYTPVSIQGTPLTTPLKPADSYTTQLEFNLPKDATGLTLLVNTVPGWPDHVVIGDENSWLHKKTYFAL
jgi:hypothetical protein